MEFRTRKLIRFSHCDPAGIGFYPRYVELVNEVVEDWCHEGLGVSFRELHGELAVGLPTVRLEMDFMIPSRLGDVLDFSLKILRIGNASMSIEICAMADEALRYRAELVVVLASLKTLSPLPIDDAWRARFEPFLVKAEDV